MNLVVNTNRIIAALIKNSYSRKIILDSSVDLLTINASEEDIKDHKQEILNKSKLTEDQFNSVYEKLKEKLTMLDDKIIQERMNEAKGIIDHIDKDDAPFIAAALATNSIIWTDDKHFERQNKIKILKTKDLIKRIYPSNAS